MGGIIAAGISPVQAGCTDASELMLGLPAGDTALQSFYKGKSIQKASEAVL